MNDRESGTHFFDEARRVSKEHLVLLVNLVVTGGLEERLQPVGSLFLEDERKQSEGALVDELGNFNTAIEVTKKLAGLKGDPQLVTVAKDKMWFSEHFVDSLLSSIVKIVNRSSSLSSPLRYQM